MKRFSRRSWGWYLTLIDRKHFKVKILRFHDKCTCSLQFHHFRNELWLLLYGKGMFEMNGVRKSVEQGDFVHVGMYDRHRFYAMGCGTVLEIQYGEKCDEEDIIRI